MFEKSNFLRNLKFEQFCKNGGTVVMTFEIDPKEVKERIERLKINKVNNEDNH